LKKKEAKLLGTLWQQRVWTVAAVDEVVVTDFTTIEEHNKNDFCCVLMRDKKILFLYKIQE